MTTISDEPQKCESGCELSVVYTDDDGVNMCVDCLIATVRDNATNSRVVTEAEVDKAAEAMAERKPFTRRDWHDLPKGVKQHYIDDATAALTALGFEVQG